MHQVKLILKKIQDAMIRLELILLDIKQQLAKKTNVGHSHDISNISGLQHTLDSKASANHLHSVVSVEDLDKLIRSLVEPKFIIQVSSTHTQATVVVKLLSSYGYCMDHVTLAIEYRKVFKSEWVLAKQGPFIYGQPLHATLRDLTPGTAYHVRLIVHDKYSPLTKLEIIDMFKTSKEEA